MSCNNFMIGNIFVTFFCIFNNYNYMNSFGPQENQQKTLTTFEMTMTTRT